MTENSLKLDTLSKDLYKSDLKISLVEKAENRIRSNIKIA